VSRTRLGASAVPASWDRNARLSASYFHPGTMCRQAGAIFGSEKRLNDSRGRSWGMRDIEMEIAVGHPADVFDIALEPHAATLECAADLSRRVCWISIALAATQGQDFTRRIILLPQRIAAR